MKIINKQSILKSESSCHAMFILDSKWNTVPKGRNIQVHGTVCYVYTIDSKWNPVLNGMNVCTWYNMWIVEQYFHNFLFILFWISTIGFCIWIFALQMYFYFNFIWCMCLFIRYLTLNVEICNSAIHSTKLNHLVIFDMYIQGIHPS
jgi:hypothetical protein